MILRVKGCGRKMPYDAYIKRLPPYALFDLKGPSEALSEWCASLPSFPEKPNSLSREYETDLCLIGPERFILRAPIDEEDSLNDTLRPESAPPEISIVRISDTHTFFRITGPDATNVASIGCPLDLHDSAFAEDAVTNSEFFGVKAMILRCDGGFEIAVEQSFGDMIADYLDRTMA